MEFKKIMSAVALMGAMTLASGTASAKGTYWDEWELQFSSGGTTGCYVCHDTSNSSFNAFGTLFKGTSHKTAAALTSAVTNVGNTINPDTNNTYGTDWAAGSLPSVSSGGSSGGGGGCVTTSIATPLTMALAMLTLGFFVRRKKD